MQPDIVLERPGMGSARSPLTGYRWNLALFAGFLGLALVTLLDLRRGFLFDDYVLKAPWYAFSLWHLLMIAAAGGGLIVFYRRLRIHESAFSAATTDRYVKVLAFVMFGMLVADLLLYRGVAAQRAAAAGGLGASWLDAFGRTGWMRPPALAVSYLLTVWHATFLGILLAGLALTVLPRYLRSLFERTGAGGSLFGAAFALPQPFCSCCAAVISPSLARRGASSYFLLAFVIGSPMLNITAIILAVLLLPAPYAILRILAGIVLTLPVTYAVAKIADRWSRNPGRTQSADSRFAWVTRWLNAYCRIFHLDELVEGRRMDTPSEFVKTWITLSGRIAILLVPSLFLLSMATAAILQALPGAYGNTGLSVVLTAVAGTLMMVSTWTEIPVSQQMLAAGMPGPAAVLLVVLPPVSLPSLVLLGSALGRFRVVALLGGAVMALGVGAGLAMM